MEVSAGFVDRMTEGFSLFESLHQPIFRLYLRSGQNGNNLNEQLKSTALTEKETLSLPPGKKWAALDRKFPLRTRFSLIKGSMNNMLLSSA